MTFRAIKPKSHNDKFGSHEEMDKKKIFPHFRIELAHLPEAKKWDIGKEYTVTLKLKMTGLSISKFQNDAEFDIIGIDPSAKVISNPKHT